MNDDSTTTAVNDALGKFTSNEDALGTFTGDGAVRLERVLPGPIERVWSHLTQADLLATWLARGAVPSRAGEAFELDFDAPEMLAAGHPGGGTMRSRVVTYEPPRLLEYTWTEHATPDGPIEASLVRFELAERGDAVALVLTHSRIPAIALASVGAGWHAHLAFLATRLSGTQSAHYMKMYDVLEPLYAAKLTVG